MIIAIAQQSTLTEPHPSHPGVVREGHRIVHVAYLWGQKDCVVCWSGNWTGSEGECLDHSGVTLAHCLQFLLIAKFKKSFRTPVYHMFRRNTETQDSKVLEVGLHETIDALLINLTDSHISVDTNGFIESIILILLIFPKV